MTIDYRGQGDLLVDSEAIGGLGSAATLLHLYRNGVSDEQLRLEQAAANFHAYIRFERSPGSNGPLLFVGVSRNSSDGFLRADTAYIWGGRTHDLDIITDNAVRMTVTSDGKVGIGKTDPSEKLEVDGKVKASDDVVLDNGGSDSPGFLARSKNTTGQEIGGTPSGQYFPDWYMDHYTAADASVYSRLRFVRGGAEILVVYPNGNLKASGNRFYAVNIPAGDRYWFAVNGQAEPGNLVLGLYSNADGSDKRVEIKGDVYVGERKSIDSQGRCLYAP